MNKIPRLTKLEWETIRHLLSHCGRWDCCGLNEKQIDILYNRKLKLSELEEEHYEGGKFEQSCK
jgi:hypothetical protein